MNFCLQNRAGFAEASRHELASDFIQGEWVLGRFRYAAQGMRQPQDARSMHVPAQSRSVSQPFTRTRSTANVGINEIWNRSNTRTTCRTHAMAS